MAQPHGGVDAWEAQDKDVSEMLAGLGIEGPVVGVTGGQMPGLGPPVGGKPTLRSHDSGAPLPQRQPPPQRQPYQPLQASAPLHDQEKGKRDGAALLAVLQGGGGGASRGQTGQQPLQQQQQQQQHHQPQVGAGEQFGLWNGMGMWQNGGVASGGGDFVWTPQQQQQQQQQHLNHHLHHQQVGHQRNGLHAAPPPFYTLPYGSAPTPDRPLSHHMPLGNGPIPPEMRAFQQHPTGGPVPLNAPQPPPQSHYLQHYQQNAQQRPGTVGLPPGFHPHGSLGSRMPELLPPGMPPFRPQFTEQLAASTQMGIPPGFREVSSVQLSGLQGQPPDRQLPNALTEIDVLQRMQMLDAPHQVSENRQEQQRAQHQQQTDNRWTAPQTPDASLYQFLPQQRPASGKQAGHHPSQSQQQERQERDVIRNGSSRGPWLGGKPSGVNGTLLCDPRVMSNELTALVEHLTPSPRELAMRQKAFASVTTVLKGEWPHCEVHLFGSCGNTLSLTNNNDLDLSIDLPDVEDSAGKAEVVERMGEVLLDASMADVTVLRNARVPVVKFVDPTTSTKCDVTVNNRLACVNTKLLRDYAALDPRMRQLVFVIKFWAKRRQVNEAYRGTLSSYCYVLMCIHLLQQRSPPVLPCLQAIEPPTFRCTVDNYSCDYCDDLSSLAGYGQRNTETLGELVWAFFEYWAWRHDYTKSVISIRTGGFLSKAEKEWTKRVGSERHLICIEDPFEVTHDLGRVVDKVSITALRKEFERAARILRGQSSPLQALFEKYSANQG